MRFKILHVCKPDMFTLRYAVCIEKLAVKLVLLRLLTIFLFKNETRDGSWYTQENVAIEGGNWATGESAVTLGIWMRILPDIIPNV